MLSTLYCIVLFKHIPLCYQSKRSKKQVYLKATIKTYKKQKVMKKQSENNFTQISKEHTNELTTVVTETLAMGLVAVKTLTSADLWNIQRRSKTMMYRRHLA